MGFACAVAAGLLVAASVAQSPTPHARAPFDLQWTRGTIVAASAESLTVRQANRTYNFLVDAATVFQIPPSAGSEVELHYAKTSGKPRAVFVFAATASPRRSRAASTGDSTVGVVHRRLEYLSIGGGRGVPSITIESKTTLLDEEGRVIAKGRRDIGRRLSVGDVVLATWYDVIVSRHEPPPLGDPHGGAFKVRYAVEIRILPQAGARAGTRLSMPFSTPPRLRASIGGNSSGVRAVRLEVLTPQVVMQAVRT